MQIIYGRVSVYIVMAYYGKKIYVALFQIIFLVKIINKGNTVLLN